MDHPTAVIGENEERGGSIWELYTSCSIFCKLGTALRNINPINLKNLICRVPNRLNKHLLDKVIDSALKKKTKK